MKQKKIFILMAALALFITSCSDNDNENDDKTDAIVGSWQYKPENTNVTVTTSDETFTSVLKDYLTKNILQDHNLSNNNLSITFKVDGIYSTVIQDGVDLSKALGTYVVDNGKLKMKLDGDEDEEITEFDMTININAMTLTFDYLASVLEQDIPMEDILIEGLFNNPEYSEQLADIDKESIEVTSIKIIQNLNKVQ